MSEDCLFCNAFMCDICHVARLSCPNTTNVGNDDASLGLFDDMTSDSLLLGEDLSSKRWSAAELEFDSW